MPMMRFISPVDPMWLSTMSAIEKRLIDDTLVRRVIRKPFDVKAVAEALVETARQIATAEKPVNVAAPASALINIIASPSNCSLT